ncbi:MAG: DUF2225 domain-containing protein [bacterium]|nr:DUF2225 domain-containing protein [bacterium]
MGVLWEKQVNCPICKNSFVAKNIKSSAVKVKERDTDFRGIYEGVNPNWYLVWVCPKCYYSCFREDFLSIKRKYVAVLQKDIQKRNAIARNSDFNKERNHYLALISYELAAHCYNITDGSKEKIGNLYLKASWLAREVKIWSLEKKFLKKALQCYLQAYESEPDLKMDNSLIVYLIGELNRRLGNYKEAIRFLGRVYDDRKGRCNLEVRRLAHEQYFIIKEIIDKEEGRKEEENKKEESI